MNNPEVESSNLSRYKDNSLLYKIVGFFAGINKLFILESREIINQQND